MNEVSVNEKVVTTKELAETLGVDKSTITRTLETMPDLVAGLQQAQINGKSGYIFNEAQATAIKVALQNKSRIAKNGFDTLTISNDLEMMLMQQRLNEYQSRRIAELQAENEAQKQKLAEQAPKVEFYDTVTQSSDAIDMKEVAKTLNIKGLGRNNLFEFLREKKILDKNNQPYQMYVSQGYFKVVENHYEYPQGCINVNLKTVVFQKGLDFIRKTIEKEYK